MPQPYFAEGTPAMIELECMVDKVGLRNVLYALAHICDAKAEHVRSNWQDKSTAKAWELANVTLDKCAREKNLADLCCL